MNTHSFLARWDIYVVGLILEIVNAYIKLKKKLDKQNNDERLKNTVRIISNQILTIPYFMAKLCVEPSKYSVCWIIFEVIIWVVLYM